MTDMRLVIRHGLKIFARADAAGSKMNLMERLSEMFIKEKCEGMENGTFKLVEGEDLADPLRKILEQLGWKRRSKISRRRSKIS